ncbi:universal stress protein [Halomarina oriensis]|uniref:Universal stress protein n=1 Tax=Halomarina oriensis TaxID=671145 RepID=A0A6B0GRK9_9EURY|nr:universal stress protein [Halomarina oriensis]MWG36279.1 universal stress protein [Halomarina oriensis]
MSLDTVLVAVGETDEDRIDALARTAADIAGPAGATVKLAHVFSKEGYRETRQALDFDRDAEVTPDVVAKRYVTIRELGDAMTDAGIEFTYHGAVGQEGETIVRLAEEFEADLVVVGGRKRSPTGKAVFGSTAQEVILNAPCPVTFVRGE